jgi:hypothetical protein
MRLENLIKSTWKIFVFTWISTKYLMKWHAEPFLSLTLSKMPRTRCSRKDVPGKEFLREESPEELPLEEEPKLIHPNFLYKILMEK